MPSTFLCKTSDLDKFGSKGLSIKIKRKMHDIFIVKQGDDFFAYYNECPHRLAQLEWNADDFLTEDKQHIICAMHGALFTIKKGDCISGPCSGESLKPIAIRIQGDEIHFG